MRSEWIPKGEIEHVLAALTPPNRLACEISLATGLRIGDVLALKTAQLKERFTIHEQKTGKTRTIRMPKGLLDRALAQAGHIYVFPHRTDGKRHRTRQAVFKDLRRAAKLFRVSAHVSPHSLRKIFAVDYLDKTRSLARVQRLLNHADEAVTMIYAMADRVDNATRRGV